MTSEQASSGRRQRKRRTTRETLIAAALDLFEENGFAATTIDEITERADVARRTFFRYFASKDAVLLPDPSEYEAGLFAALDRQQPPLTMGRMLEAFREATASIEHDEALQRRRAAVAAENQLQVATTAMTTFITARDTVIGHLADRTGLPESNPTLHLGVNLGLFAMAHAYVRWAGGVTEGSLGEEFQATVELLRRLISDEIALDGSAS
jgi:AcrR family transcriptional regulator